MSESQKLFECFEVASDERAPATSTVVLTFDQRQKSRGQAQTDGGDKVAWFIERGKVLADGDLLISRSGEYIRVQAAAETVSEVHSGDAHLLMRAAYHLGNRHVPLQIDSTSLRYQHDHVLDDMLRGLGLQVNCVEKTFHPERGAYHKHGGESQGHHHHSHSR